ncbi:MAG: SagB family peptide dehydrogenase [Hydrogenophaga sp.]
MTDPYLLKLRPAVRLHGEGDDLLLACADGRGLRSRCPGPGIRALLEDLTQDGGWGQSEQQLVERATAAEPQADASRLYFLLDSLKNKGFLNYTLAAKGLPLATLEPISPGFHFHSAAHQGALRLSRFACLRREGEVVLVESPLGHARLVLHDARLCALPALLATPRSMDALATALPAFAPSLLDAAVVLLINAGVVFRCDDSGRIAEESAAALRQWEFHDLFFHTRSRSGRHEYPLGGTYRFKAELAHAPALKAPMSEQRTALYRPAADSTGPDFFTVLEARRSRRTPGETPLTLSQLGEFLWRSARVQAHSAADPQHPGSYESTSRPYPGGGAVHELELYLTVSRCEGLAPGLYHYDPLAHELERVADLGKKQQTMVQQAMNSSGLNQPPDVLITLAARFGRVAWKYEGVAYALTQKNVGGLYQQMYLVATALGLAPCALGAGNSDIFSEATGMDYFTETSVGEFLLSAG